MPRTRQQNLDIKEQRQRQIMDAALILFSKKGYDNTTINNIATEANISHGLFYHYFNNKDDVLDALLKDETETFTVLHQIFGSGDNSPDVVMEQALTYIVSGLSNRKDKLFAHQINLLLSIEEQKSLKKMREKVMAKGGKSPFDILNEIISKGQVQGVFRDDVLSYDLTLIYYNFIKGLVRSKVYRNARPFKVPQVDALMQLIRK